MPAAGNRLAKGKKRWNCCRPLNPTVLSKHNLLDNGSELWFAVTVKTSKATSYDLIFGLRNNAEKRSDTEIGFKLQQGSLKAMLSGEGAGETRAGWTHRRAEEKFPSNKPHLIIGRCVWSKTDSVPDTVEIYRVFDAPGLGPMVIEEPISHMKAIVNQAKLNTVFLSGSAKGSLDEIRIGPTRQSVLLGTAPLGKTAPQKGLKYGRPLPSK